MIILYGGSFNPPTIAHFKIAKHLINKYQPKRFIFIPVGDSYHKSELIPFKYRYEMIQLLTKKLKNAIVSDYENEFKDFKGTIGTLNYFKKQYPNEEIYYVIGADNLSTFDQWIEYKNLLKSFKFIVINRDNIDLEKVITENKYLNINRDNIIIEKDIERIKVSSTQYRKDDKDSVVSDEVNQFIYNHKLYQRGERNEE